MGDIRCAMHALQSFSVHAAYEYNLSLKQRKHEVCYSRGLHVDAEETLFTTAKGTALPSFTSSAGFLSRQLSTIA